MGAAARLNDLAGHLVPASPYLIESGAFGPKRTLGATASLGPAVAPKAARNRARAKRLSDSKMPYELQRASPESIWPRELPK